MKNDSILFDLKNEKRRIFEDLVQKKELRDKALKELDGFEELKANDREYLFDEFKIISDLENEANSKSKYYHKQHDPARSKMHSTIRKGYTALRLTIKQYQDDIKEEKNKLREYCQQKESDFKNAQEDYKSIIDKISNREQFLSDERHKKSQYHESIAKLAGIPEQHLNNYIVVTDNVNGYHQVYFGGDGSADGDGHGHYCVKTNGTIVKCREAEPKKISA